MPPGRSPGGSQLLMVSPALWQPSLRFRSCQVSRSGLLRSASRFSPLPLLRRACGSNPTGRGSSRGTPCLRNSFSSGKQPREKRASGPAMCSPRACRRRAAHRLAESKPAGERSGRGDWLRIRPGRAGCRALAGSTLTWPLECLNLLTALAAGRGFGEGRSGPMQSKRLRPRARRHPQPGPGLHCDLWSNRASGGSIWPG